jgi:hypothetical protein
MIKESVTPVGTTNATGGEECTNGAEPCGAVEYWDTVLRWIAFETPATRWLASVQVPEPDSENRTTLNGSTLNR